MKNIVRFLLIIAFVALSGFFSYKSYLEYQNYQIVQKSDKTIVWMKRLNQILNLVEQERSHSAVYLGFKGKTDFKNLESLREKTDIGIKDAKIFIEKNPQFSSYVATLTKLSDSLQYVRSRVDVVSLDYKSVLFLYYQDEISKPLLFNLEKNIYELAQGFRKINNHLFSYLDFVKYKNSIDKERSFIAYILSLSKKMDEEDLIVWDDILEADIYPPLDKLDNQISIEIKDILQIQNSSQMIFNKRVQVAKGVIKGQYAVAVSQWFDSIDEKIKRVKSCEDILYKQVKTTIDNRILSKQWIIIYAVLAIISIIIALVMILFKKKPSRRRKGDDVETKVLRARDDDMIEVSKNSQRVQKPVVSNNVKVEENKPTYNKVPAIKPVDYRNIAETANEIELFNTLEVFAATIEPFKQKALQKDIDLNYFIDPSIPSFCMGNISKLKQILALIIDHTIDSTSSREVIKVNIDQTAGNKIQSAIEFSVSDSGGYISKRLKDKIETAIYHSERGKTHKFGNIESDLMFASKEIAKMGGINNIKSKTRDGSTFAFTLSLKKA